MTSWIWMKDVDVAVADPIDPITEDDVRPVVKDLIKEHQAKIDEIRSKIEKEPLFDKTKHDDLWIMRFHLSHKKKTKEAIKAAKETLEFRKKYNLDDTDIRDHPPYESLREDVRKWYTYTNKNIRHTIPDKQRGVIIYMKIKLVDLDGMCDNLNDDELLSQHLYNSEWAHQWLDYITRTTGRLTKSIRIADFKDVGREKVNFNWAKRYSMVCNQMEDYYPQLLETGYMVNPVGWMKVLWDKFSPLLPKRLSSKIDFIIPKDKPKERAKLYKHVTEEHLPEFLGGKNDLPIERLT